MIRTSLLAYAMLLGTAASSLADTQSEKLEEAERQAAEIRQMAVDAGDTTVLARYAISDFAKAAAYVDTCSASNNEPAIEDMAIRYGEWAEPGVMASVNGRRTAAKESVLSAAKLSYAGEALSVMRSGCNQMQLTIRRMGLDVQSGIFESYLKMQPTQSP